MLLRSITFQVCTMNKISVISAMVSDVRIRETTPIPARSAISPLELTPLPTPGSTREPTSAGATGASPTELPAGRHAVFDRSQSVVAPEPNLIWGQAVSSVLLITVIAILRYSGYLPA
jgi:hypothetical protein